MFCGAKVHERRLNRHIVMRNRRVRKIPKKTEPTKARAGLKLICKTRPAQTAVAANTEWRKLFCLFRRHRRAPSPLPSGAQQSRLLRILRRFRLVDFGETSIQMIFKGWVNPLKISRRHGTVPGGERESLYLHICQSAQTAIARHAESKLKVFVPSWCTSTLVTIFRGIERAERIYIEGNIPFGTRIGSRLL